MPDPKLVPHQFGKLKLIPWPMCKGCGLVRLRNPLTDWCDKHGCEHEDFGETMKDAEAALMLLYLVQNGLPDGTTLPEMFASIRGVPLAEAELLMHARHESALAITSLYTVRALLPVMGEQVQYPRALAAIAGWTEARARQAYEVAAQAGWLSMPDGEKRGGLA